MFTLPNVGMQSIAISVSVCLSVCPVTSSQKPHAQISPNFLYMLPGRGLDLLWQQCNMLYISIFKFCGWHDVFTQWSDWSRVKDAMYVLSSSWRHPGRSLPFLTAYCFWTRFGSFCDLTWVYNLLWQKWHFQRQCLESTCGTEINLL